MNLLSTLNKKNYTLRRSARLLATQGINVGGVNEPDGSRGIQTSKRKCAVAINRPSLELQSEPELALKKKRILGKEHVDPDYEDTRPSKRKRGPQVEPVYIIPDLVEKKKTTFRGRLG
jgi:UV DNA damage endonuclease